MDQPDQVATPAGGQLTRENYGENMNTPRFSISCSAYLSCCNAQLTTGTCLKRLNRQYTKFDFAVDEGKDWLNSSREKN